MMFPASLRMMAPLQAQNQQLQMLQAQNQELQARCDGLQSKCQELHRQVAALQPLAGRVRALEGVGTEEGGRRQQQRVGPAPHDAPPSDAEVDEMGLAAAVAALRAHVLVARVAQRACQRLESLDQVGSEQAFAEAGVVEAVVAALRTHPQFEALQRHGCFLLGNLCYGDDAAVAARRQQTVAAGAV